MVRRSVLLVLALALIISILPTPGSGVAAGPALYPDLKTTKPSGLYVDRVTMSDGLSHYVLRFSNTVWNAGEGRLELQGDPSPNGGNKIYQNFYDARTGGTRVLQRQVSSDILYHPSHYHYHFQGFASYQLLNRDSSGVYQPTTKRGTKTSFCIMDVTRVATSGPTWGQYDGCGGTFQGLSVGWGDTYEGSLPEQWIDLGTSRLPDGSYAIESIADPQNKLDEGGRDSNNVGTTYFSVSGGVISIHSAPTTAACIVSPVSGASGSSATVTCSDFNARETVEVYWNTTTSVPIAKATSDKTGRVVITINIPQGRNSGYPLIVIGVSSRRQDTLIFRLNNPVVPTPTPDFLVPPGSNPTFSGSKLPIAASSSSVPSTLPGNAYDGSLSTHWYTYRGEIPASAILTFDLGGTRQLSGVKWTYRLPEMDSMVLQVSSDGTNWTTVSATTARERYTWEGSSTKAQARYVRMVFNNPSGRLNLGYVSEVQIWGSSVPISSAPTGSNPSFIGSKLPIVSSTRSVPSTSPRNAHDGNLGTHWYTYQAGVPTSATLTFDLGAPQRLSGVKWTYRMPEMDTMTLQVSLDGTTWSTISVTTARAQHTWEGTSTNKRVRYVRMVFNNPSGRANFGYVSEVQIWGSPSGSTTSTSTTTSALRTSAATPVATAAVMATPAQVASPTLVPTNTPSPSPTIVLTGTPIQAIVPTESPAPDLVPVDTSTPAGVSTEAPVPTMVPTDIAEPTAVVEPTPLPTETPVPTMVPTDIAEPTAVVEPTTLPANPVIMTGRVVTTDGAMLACRSEPVSGSVLSQLAPGSTVSITGPAQAGWYPVLCETSAGWVSAEFVLIEGEDLLPPQEPVEVPTEVAEIPVENGIEPTPTEQPTEIPVEVPTTEPEPVITTRQQVVNVAADASVTANGTPPDPSLLALGGADQSVALLSFDISGIEGGTVVGATLVVTGGVSGPGGTLAVLPGVRIDEASASWSSAQNGIGVGEVGAIIVGAQTTLDVTGYVHSDGVVTFVITGSPEQLAAIASRESGAPAYLVLVIEE